VDGDEKGEEKREEEGWETCQGSLPLAFSSFQFN